MSTVSVPGRVKACDACRHLKLRCDAHETNYNTCSRCRKMDRDCVISNRRTRQTKAELQREIDNLRSKPDKPGNQTSLESSPWEFNGNSEFSNRSNSAVTPETFFPNLNARLPTPQLPTHNALVHAINWEDLKQQSVSNPSQLISSSVNLISPSSNPSPAQSSDLGTIPRMIGGVELNERKINGCFDMFFEYYAPAAPGILGASKTPNEIYEYSEPLFWTVVYIGSRKYSKDPTIVEFLAKPLKELVQQFLFDPEHAISTIQAVLALCLWPWPTNSTFKDQRHAIAGAAMQLAIQKGLHYASRKQDFVRTVLKQSDEGDKQFRARLWIYCQIVFPRTSFYDGLPFIQTLNHAFFNQSIFDDLPPFILYRYHLHRVEIDAIASIMKTTDLESTKDSNLLNTLIDHFDTQSQQITSPEDSDICRFTLSSVRLLIRAFHFHSEPSTERTTGLLQTYFISVNLIKTASQLDKSRDFANYCNSFQARAIALAAMCILRIHRSNMRTQINADFGEEMFFEAIRMSKKRSIQNNDLDARTAVIFTQLWSSTRLFKFRDGEIDGLKLLLRGRLSMSVFYDCLWWWRMEFEGTWNPYIEAPENEALIRTNTPGSAVVRSVSTNAETFPGLLPDTLEVPDWDFGIDLDWNFSCDTPRRSGV